jgi:hypothetical protein
MLEDEKWEAVEDARALKDKVSSSFNIVSK